MTYLIDEGIHQQFVNANSVSKNENKGDLTINNYSDISLVTGCC